MSMPLADARFLFHRATGLLRRGWASLRARGWRATWARVRDVFERSTAAPRTPPWRPADAPFTPFALPATLAADAPRASIVIPVYGQFARTLACLRALAAHPPAALAEVIVVDDGSSDETPEALPRVAGLRFHRRAANGGFIAACNDGASLSRGEVVVFLNNDTIPQPGWLDALLRTFDTEPNVGLVGAQLRYPDDRLQEAGGVVFSDGSAWNYGRFAAPEDCRYAYLRDCDYVSGAAIALPRALFADLGGFSATYAPAYYEDTDLAFAVRARGLRVVYQPDSVVVHDEGGTAGTDLNAGPKAAQVRNQGRFLERWRETLATHPAPGTVPSPAVVHARQRQVLIVDALTPHPDHDSGSLRLVNLMRLLREEGAHVVFLPANRRDDGAATHALQAMGVECWHAPFAARAPAWFREHGARFDTIVLCRHYVASEFLPLARQHAPQARVVFDTVDLHYLRERRGAEVAGDQVALRAADRTRTRELDLIARSDATLVVSDVERTLLATDAPGARVDILSNLHQLAGPGLPFAQRHDLVFVGGFRHPPNVDAVRWFVESVFPRVRARLPDVRFHCIGGHVPDEIRVLDAIDGVHVHGHLPDIDPYMDGARIALAPLRYGAGVKGKVNLSMAHGQPVVATSCAVEGMHLRDGDDVLVADAPEAFAEAIVRLHEDEALWERLRDAGLRNVAAHFSLDAGRDVVRRVLLRQDA
ncbi:glycosyl transferase family protein [Lysobacter helvus]|uniref:Glycosyl transferase family protein n=2 Tax=Lysobacteraceae TaxID=32033 RepID=A0ABN6FPU2_9GAMM|nr:MULTISPECIES: glycosyltransferase [Lysobacter]BCT91608.1 glycosyl transferase family protein [Lysobacter caseinilyticus]BCT94761.1 glycosyl transferase family protein [Lysobacter helvus]